MEVGREGREGGEGREGRGRKGKGSEGRGGAMGGRRMSTETLNSPGNNVHLLEHPGSKLA